MSLGDECFDHKKYGFKTGSDIVFGLRVNGELRPFYVNGTMGEEIISLVEKHQPEVVPDVKIEVNQER